MRKSKKAAKGGKPEPEEAIMKEPTKRAEEQTIDPMDFLEATPVSLALDEVDQDFANENDEPALIDAAVPSAADLDAVAEEQAIADMTGAVIDSPEIKQEAVPQEPEPAKPIPPALPRRAGCEHGFPNVALCVTCRASGRR